jgi:hypothetical protein
MPSVRSALEGRKLLALPFKTLFNVFIYCNSDNLPWAVEKRSVEILLNFRDLSEPHRSTALAWSETQQRIRSLLERGLQREVDFENRWPEVLGMLLET